MTEIAHIDQAVIFCGSLKPLLPISGKPFLERLLFEIKRHGLRRILLLATQKSPAFENFLNEMCSQLSLDIAIEIVSEDSGTGGALWHTRDRLDERFFLLDGQCWFDFNLLDLAAAKAASSASIISMALRQDISASGRDSVELEEGFVIGIESSIRSKPALVSSGVFVIDRSVLTKLRPECSFEHDVLPMLAHMGAIDARIYDGFFIDIGSPADYELAQLAMPPQQRRRAVFLDRDGVINVDHGYVGEIERFDWLPGAKTAIKTLNDRGFFVFIVTNQSGVAHGFYTEDSVRLLHEHIIYTLADIGAHIDDFRYCPFHPDGSVPAYARVSDWRKPAPGMLLDLIAKWPIDVERSIMIGDRESDVLAGKSAGLSTYRIGLGEDLGQALRPFLTP